MMIISSSESPQDTVPVKGSIFQHSGWLKSDSLSYVNISLRKDSVYHIPVKAAKPVPFVYADTSLHCFRNSIADITFYDSNNVISKIEHSLPGRFPFDFMEKNRKVHDEAGTALLKQLKPGSELPQKPYHNDFIIVVILFAAFLYSIIRSSSQSLFLVVSRFFLFRGINDPSLRDIGGLFHWHSTVINLISFLILGLFFYSAAEYYDFIPPSLVGIKFWLIALGIIIAVITLHHIMCIITGNASGQREVFREYLLAVYQSYRFSALFMFVIIVLMSYTALFTVSFFITSGIVVLFALYLIRIFRLLIIFINRNISIFYLILYLCALEILPVLITIKYFTGLV
jgi:hypothetical protein